MKKLIFILPLLYYSCTDDIVADIDALQTENAEQDAQIDSLMTALNDQQAYIYSLNNIQNIAVGGSSPSPPTVNPFDKWGDFYLYVKS